MKIAYIRSVFPKNSETFLMEEVIQLKKAGNIVRIYAGHFDFAGFHPKVFQHNLLDDVIYEGPGRVSLLQALRFFVSLLKNPSHRKIYFRNYFPGKGPDRGFTGLGTLFKGILLSTQLGNLSIAFNQASKSRDGFKPDIIHCPFAFERCLHKLKELHEKFPETPYTMTLRSRDMYLQQISAEQQKIKESLLERAHQIMTISEHNRQILTGRMKTKQPIKIIHSSIDPFLFEPDMKIQKKPNQLVSVARLVPKKGMENLIEACALVRDRGFEFRCFIVGDGPLREKLKTLILKLELTSQIRLCGVLPQNGVKRLLDESEIFILPCVIAEDGDRDILPNSLKEAMAMKLAVITTNISGIEELILDQQQGILTNSEPNEIADKICQLLGDKALGLRMGESAREKVLLDFNIHIEGQKFSRVLQEAAS